MLDSIHGRILEVTPAEVVVDLGAFAVRARASSNTIGRLRIGETVRLFSLLRVKEEELALFAFAREDEREVFLTLLQVSGLGPEKAITLLSVFAPEALARTIEDGDSKRLKAVRGVGDKLAQRIVLELSGKLGALAATGAPAVGRGAPKETVRDLVAALAQLGYPKSTAESLADVALRERGPNATLEDLVKHALRQSQSSPK